SLSPSIWCGRVPRPGADRQQTATIQCRASVALRRADIFINALPDREDNRVLPKEAGMPDSAVMQDIRRVARELAVETAALAAVAHVESGLKPHAMVDGKPEPLIRFEGHYLDRRLAGAAREEARRQGLASPQAGKVKNPTAQAARWALLARAAAI